LGIIFDWPEARKNQTRAFDIPFSGQNLKRSFFFFQNSSREDFVEIIFDREEKSKIFF
jgi:hypothetical protein